MREIIIISILCSLLSSNSNIGIVKSIEGKVCVKRADKILNLYIGSILKQDDIIITKSSSAIGITFEDGSRVVLGENSIFNINRYIFKPAKNSYDIDLKLIKGKALFNSGKIGKMAPEAVKFEIPEGVVGIRGTEFIVEVD